MQHAETSIVNTEALSTLGSDITAEDRQTPAISEMGRSLHLHHTKNLTVHKSYRKGGGLCPVKFVASVLLSDWVPNQLLSHVPEGNIDLLAPASWLLTRKAIGNWVATENVDAINLVVWDNLWTLQHDSVP
jgi:hypothetical protein